MAAYLHSLPKPSMRNDAFDIAFSLFERKKEFRDENVESEVPSSENWKSEDHINIYTSPKFLLTFLKTTPQILLFIQKFCQKVSDQIIFILQTPLNVACLTLQLTILGHTLKQKTQISCIVRLEKMLIQAIWMITSTFITIATETHIRDRMYQSIT